jgi:S-adenosylmethionine decarboxylase
MSSHPLITKGTHLILDIYDINDNEILKYENSIITILDDIVNKFNLNVVGKILHQFNPYGVTGVYVLSESHLAIHTFVDEKKISMDLYTCNIFNRKKEFVEYITNIFNTNKYNYNCIDR